MQFQRYYQITEQLLLEYTCDQYNIVNNKSNNESSSTTVYMYQGADGLQYCLDAANTQFLKFADENQSTYYYPGKNITDIATLFRNNKNSDEIYGDNIVYDGQIFGTLLKNITGQTERDIKNLHKDKIKIYLCTGYQFNSIAGISLRVKGKVNYVYYRQSMGSPNYQKRINDYIILLDYYLPKEMLPAKDNIEYLAQPFYMNNKFYDRCIEISFPSPYDCALNQQDIDFIYETVDKNNDNIYFRGNIYENAPVIVEFATISPDYISLKNVDSTDYAATFSTDSIRQLSINVDSNAKYFNVNLMADPRTNTILYYPVYGIGNNMQDFNIDIMAAIDNGHIPMLDDDENTNGNIDGYIDEFDEGAYRWVIINELTVTYNYQYIYYGADKNTPITDTEYYSNTIDYTGKDLSHGEFWKSRFVLYPKSRQNMEVTSCFIKYTCHLYNRLNCIDIAKSASMCIDRKEIGKYLPQHKQLNISNINDYKIINKINKVSAQAGTNKETVIEKYIKTYYDVTTLIIKDMESGQMYTNGKMTLRLKHTNSNYMIRLYINNNENVRIPYDLTGTEKYKLVFPSISGDKIKIYPNMDSENNNLGIGALVFYISEQNVKQIMNVPASERYFALMTDNTDMSQESTLYEGRVDYYN